MRPAYPAIGAIILFFASLAFALKAHALTIDPYGNIVVGQKEGRVLSKSDDEGGSDRDGSSESNGSGSNSSGSSGSQDEKKDEVKSEEKRTETTTTGGAVIRTREKDGEVRTETRLPSGVRIKTRQEEDKTRVDIYEGGQKLRLERKDGRTIIKLENEAGEETELPTGSESEVFKIEERADKGQVRVRAAGEKFIVQEASISATTKFPLSVNLGTNELTVTTPAGTKVVTVLPAQAVKNMLAANVIDQVKGIPFTQDVQKVATEAGTTLEQVINLSTTKEGVLAYEIRGIRVQRLLGFMRVEIPKTAVISAETGEVLEVQQSPLSTILDLVSF